ncbi:hypothetical protein JAAARDRAFT_199787 [Jaapia argillacea MUCL 33604]|uniref:Uncharacterized protein n=1 Tax=Jaapia argillacea MUCL 33604 TaxID=933084 RepID=A0A067PJL7_9AGAM|nr:hypothetical protein JAAARDRAFT_199787 [Jaapia argillacea MUCL 33604]
MTKDWRCGAFDDFIIQEFYTLPHNTTELNKAMKVKKALNLEQDPRNLDWKQYARDFPIDFGVDNNGNSIPFWADGRASIILGQIKREFELMKKEEKTTDEEDEEYSPVPKPKTQRKGNNYTTNFLIDFGADDNGDLALFWADRRAPIILSQIKHEFELTKNEDKSEVAKEKKTYIEEDEEYSLVPKWKTQQKKCERDIDDEEVVIPPGQIKRRLIPATKRKKGVRKSTAKSLPSKDKEKKLTETSVAKKSKAKSVTFTDEEDELAEMSAAKTSTAKSVPAKGKKERYPLRKAGSTPQ